jgi:hypothetical protein
MSDLSDTEILRAIKELKIVGDILPTIRMFEYQGFSITGIYRKMRSVARDDELIGDIITLVVVAMTRGTNIDSILSKSEDPAVKKLANLKVKYDIRNNVTGKLGGSSGNKQKDIITLNRIMSSFPHLCYEVAKLGYARDPTTENFKIDKAFRFSSAPALFDNSEMFEDWCEWAVAFDKIINTKPDATRVREFGLIVFKTTQFKSILGNKY